MAYDVKTLVKDLNSVEWFDRSEAIRRLEVLGDRSAAASLIQTLRSDESQFVRAAAARALGKLGAAEAVPALIRALDDPAFHVRQNALWALGDLGAAAEPALPRLSALTQSKVRYPQAELTEAEMATLVVKRIELALAAAQAATQAPAAAPAEAEAPKLSAEERAAKREAALARKRAREGGGE